MAQSDLREVALRVLKRSRGDPAFFVRHVLKAEPTPQQLELLEAVAKPGAHVAVKSGHGTGKSTVLSWLILWFLLTHKDARVPCTAPSAHQLSDVLWAEIARWINQMHDLFKPHVLWSSEAIRIKGAEQTQFAVARTARPEKPEALQGFHAPNMLFLIDEASGVPDAVFEVAQGALTSPDSRVVMTSNPTLLTGYFYEAFHRQRDSWDRLTFSAVDSPIVAPEYCAEMAGKYGEDSDMYKVRVLGEFPSASVCQFIPLPIVQEAMGKVHGMDVYKWAPKVLGVDVARFGDDKSVIQLRQGLHTERPVAYQGLDTMELADRVARVIVDHTPQMTFVDEGGVGGGVIDRLRQLGHRNVVGVPFSGKSGLPECNNKRAEMWWLLRDWLKNGGSLPDVQELKDDLIGPEYYYTQRGTVNLESKEDMKKRGLASPDYADALALTFAFQVRPDDALKHRKPKRIAGKVM